MPGFLALFLLTVCGTHEVVGKLGPPGGPQRLHHDVVDTLKAFSSFKYAVSISNSDNDTFFECMYTTQTDVDLDAGTATYAWFFPGIGGAITLYVMAGDEPEALIFTVDDDPTQFEGLLYYTDYDNCIITDLEYQGHQCTLWAQRAVKDNVPQHCIDYFVDICGVTVPQHNRDLCPDGEGDY